jgi:hypothetical protein
MADNPYFQPIMTLGSDLTARQYQTTRAQLLHNINNTMEGGDETRALDTESFSITMGHDDYLNGMMMDGVATRLQKHSNLDYEQERRFRSFVSIQLPELYIACIIMVLYWLARCNK